MNGEYVIAKYLRLSSDDGVHGDSQSIIGQRHIIDDFIKLRPEFKDARCSEYCDDGFSGVNFSRPSVEKLLSAAKRGQIQCIIVKDFSRFGRNYIEVGDYIEQIFPFLGIRFISVTDNYDSALRESDAGDIGVAFKHVLNDYYCKDLSRKVKNGYRAKWETGKYLSSYNVYGYQKRADDRYRLEKDSVTAPVVRRIFDLALSGNSPSQIAKILNFENIPTPMAYVCQKMNTNSWSNLKKLWTGTKIVSIIRDLRYTGAITCGMYAVKELGSCIKHKTPQSEWYIKENMHEPIVSKEEYDGAQLCIRKIKIKDSNTPSPYTFPVRIRCGGCGHALVKNGAKVMAYYCRYGNSISDNDCFSEKIEYEALKNVILTSVQRLYELADKQKAVVSKSENNDSAVDALKRIQSLQKEIKRLTGSKLTLYNQYSDNEINLGEYTGQRDAIDEKIKELSSRVNLLEKSSFLKENQLAETNPIIKALEGIPYPAEYSDRLVTELIEYVTVFDKERIEIKWKFADDSIVKVW
jgi:DNA invertase Pin-like site-specific DNA recombinase